MLPLGVQTPNLRWLVAGAALGAILTLSAGLLAQNSVWTSPRTWVSGAELTAAQLNAHLRDNLTWLYDNRAADWSKVSGTGQAPTARLGTGTASATTFLAGDQSYQSLAGTDVPAATTGARGTVELATNSEAETGTATARVVTPANLGSLTTAVYFRDADVPATPATGSYYVAPSMRTSITGRFSIGTADWRGLDVTASRIFVASATTVDAYDHDGTRQSGDDLHANCSQTAMQDIAIDATYCYAQTLIANFRVTRFNRSTGATANMITFVTNSFQIPALDVVGSTLYAMRVSSISGDLQERDVDDTGSTSAMNLGEDLPSNLAVTGVAVTSTHVYVLDNTAKQIRSFALSDGSEHTADRVQLDGDVDGDGLAFLDGRYFVIDDNANEVLIYEVAGTALGIDMYEGGAVYQYDGSDWTEQSGGLPILSR